MESARALGVPLPATAVVQELFSALRVKGRGGLDHSGVITLLEDLAGASVRATVDRAGLDPQGRLPKVQIRRVRKGDLVEGPRRHRADLRRLPRAPARHAAPPGVQRRPVRAPPLAHGAVGLLRRRGGRREARRRRARGHLGHASGCWDRWRCSRTTTTRRSASSSSAPRRSSSRRTRRRCTARVTLPDQRQAPGLYPQVRLPARSR